ncbi:MAG: phosphoglycerate kinase [Firmicutes bacterium ML8_F2]|nr:MAG: phosphoglycerate kinase [Firmicutes bacterium ML8_F2]
MSKKSIEDVEVAGKKILMRSDFNVPLENGRVRDDNRIKAAVPTIESLINRGARVVLASHLGRPGGEPKPELKMDPVAERLALILGRPVHKINSVVGPEVKKRVAEMQEGEVLILENLRFEKGEEKNDPEFARQLAEPFALFVNDAFGTAHRAHASTAGVASYLPAVAGLLMKKEIDELSRCLNDPVRPLTAIIGGAKVSDKLNVIRRFLDLADNLLLGGGMANTFLVADGFILGDSFYEEEMVEEAADLLDESEESGCCLLLPVDLAVTEELRPGSPFKNLSPEKVEKGGKAVDIGPETVALFADIIADAAMIVWNGPLGVFEMPPFDSGTAGVAAAVAGSEAYSVVGGGDLVAALEGLGLTEKISFISTGGGATLEFWEGKELPGIAVLQDK